jgi:hypothetical protein
MVAKLSALRTGRTLLPRDIFMLLALISVIGQAHGVVLPEGLGKLKKLIHFIGSRTRDLLACSIVPYPLRYRVPPISVRS